MNTKRGPRGPYIKLTDEQKREILASTLDVSIISRKMNINKSAVYRVIKNRRVLK